MLLPAVAFFAGEATGKAVSPLDLAPILSTGVVGLILLMILFRFKIMPTWVFDEAKKEWERERTEMSANWDRERATLQETVSELKAMQRAQNDVYVSQVIPTLTRVLDSEQELLAIRRADLTRKEKAPRGTV